MKVIIAIVLAIVITSCHVLKKDKLSLKNLRQKEVLQFEEQRNIKSQQSELVLADSSHNDFINVALS